MRIIHSTPHSTVSVIEPEPSKLLAPATELEMPYLSNLVPLPHLPDYVHHHQPWGRDDQHDVDADSEEEWDNVIEPHQLAPDSCGMMSERDEYDPVFSAHLDPSLLLLSKPSTPPFSPSLASNSSPAYSPSSSSSPSPPPTNTCSRQHRAFLAARRHKRLIPVPPDNMMTPMSKKRLALALRRPSPGSLRKHELFKPEVMSLFNPRNTRGSPEAPQLNNNGALFSNGNTPVNVATNSMMMAPPLMGNPWSLGLGLEGEGDEEGYRGAVEMSSQVGGGSTSSSSPMNYEAWEQEILNDLPGIMGAEGGEMGEVDCSPSWLD